MVIAVSDSGEEEIRKFINEVAEICLSDEFINLKNELESLYLKNGIENALLTAFQDALFSIFTQREGVRNTKKFVY